MSKKSKQAKKKSSCLATIFKLIIVALALGIGGLFALFTVLAQDLPDLHKLEDYQPVQVSRVFDHKGEMIARFGRERRTVIPDSAIPKHVKNAFLAAEDEDFYQHEGLDYKAIVAAVLNEVKVKIFGGSRRGGSTITQQTAKNFLLSSEKTVTRKLKEMILAKRIEEEFTKDEILYLYLNQIYFGHGAYGIEEAAKTYYARSTKDLTLAQAASLASVPKWPNKINPLSDVKRLKLRKAYVLKQMLKNKMINADEQKAAMKEAIQIVLPSKPYLGSADYFMDHVRTLLKDKIPEEDLKKGGLRIETSLDAKMQMAANLSTKQGLREVDKRQGYRGPLLRITNLKNPLNEELQKSIKEERKSRFSLSEEKDKSLIWDLKTVTSQKVQKNHQTALLGIRSVKLEEDLVVGALVKHVDEKRKIATIDLGSRTGEITLKSMRWARVFGPVKWTKRPKKISDVIIPGDVILVRIVEVNQQILHDLNKKVSLQLEQDPKAEGAFVAISPQNHRVRALVGGFDYNRSNFNRAIEAKRQPGSSFKPFIYATGLETKNFTALGFLEDGRSRPITDAPKVFFDRWTGKKWNPRNSGGKYRGDISLRTCLTYSINTCSISILEKVGIDKVHDIAKRVHLIEGKNTFPKNLTLALGTGEVQLLNLVNAYSIFPNGGVYAPPVLVEKVQDSEGHILYSAQEGKEERIISPETAFIMSDLMKSVVEHGTATKAKLLGRPVAGKTGTTNQARSVWFAGFSPHLVAGAYVGFDNNEPLGKREYGGKAALPIWLRFMSRVLSGHKAQDFEKPDGIVEKIVDSKTGLLTEKKEEYVKDEIVDEYGEDLDDSSSVNDEIADDIILPKGAMREYFMKGTEPELSIEESAPPPFDLLELNNGIAP